MQKKLQNIDWKRVKSVLLGRRSVALMLAVALIFTSNHFDWTTLRATADVDADDAVASAGEMDAAESVDFEDNDEMDDADVEAYDGSEEEVDDEEEFDGEDYEVDDEEESDGEDFEADDDESEVDSLDEEDPADTDDEEEDIDSDGNDESAEAEDSAVLEELPSGEGQAAENLTDGGETEFAAGTEENPDEEVYDGSEEEEEEPEEEEASDMPAGTLADATTEGLHVRVEYGENVFPDSVSMIVEDVEEDAALLAASNDIPHVAQAAAANISFMDEEGDRIQPAGKVKVKLALDEALTGDEFVVAHIDDYGWTKAVDSEDVEKITADEAIFEAGEFSIYAILAIRRPAVQEETAAEPATAGSSTQEGQAAGTDAQSSTTVGTTSGIEGNEGTSTGSGTQTGTGIDAETGTGAGTESGSGADAGTDAEAGIRSGEEADSQANTETESKSEIENEENNNGEIVDPAINEEAQDNEAEVVDDTINNNANTEGTETEAAEEEKDVAAEAVPEEVQPEEAAMPAGELFDVTPTGVHVRAAFGEGVFPRDVYMVLADLPKEEAIESVEGAMEDKSIVDAVAVDITFRNEQGEELQPEGENTVSVSMWLDEPLEAPKGEEVEAAVAHIDNDGEAEIIADSTNETEGQVSENGAEFEAEAFSTYVLFLSTGNGMLSEVTVSARSVEIEEAITPSDDVERPFLYQNNRGSIPAAGGKFWTVFDADFNQDGYVDIPSQMAFAIRVKAGESVNVSGDMYQKVEDKKKPTEGTVVYGAGFSGQTFEANANSDTVFRFTVDLAEQNIKISAGDSYAYIVTVGASASGIEYYQTKDVLSYAFTKADDNNYYKSGTSYKSEGSNSTALGPETQQSIYVAGTTAASGDTVDAIILSASKTALDLDDENSSTITAELRNGGSSVSTNRKITYTFDESVISVNGNKTGTVQAWSSKKLTVKPVGVGYAEIHGQLDSDAEVYHNCGIYVVQSTVEEPNVTYTGDYAKPKIKIEYGVNDTAKKADIEITNTNASALVETVQATGGTFSATYGETKNITKDGSVTISGTGAFEDYSTTKSFAVVSRSLSEVTVTDKSGKVIIEAGEEKNEGSITKEYVNDAYVSLKDYSTDSSSFDYKIKLTSSTGGVSPNLSYGSDFVAELPARPGSRGKHYLTIKPGSNGNYSGSLQIPYTVTPRNLLSTSITWYVEGNEIEHRDGTVFETGYSTTFDGHPKYPAVRAVQTLDNGNTYELENDSDYTCEYANNTSVSTNEQRAQILVTLGNSGLYELEDTPITLNFSISKKSISGAKIDFSIASDKTVTINQVLLSGNSLTKDEDYTYADGDIKPPTQAGEGFKGSITIHGMGNYSGSETAECIYGLDLSKNGGAAESSGKQVYGVPSDSVFAAEDGASYDYTVFYGSEHPKFDIVDSKAADPAASLSIYYPADGGTEPAITAYDLKVTFDCNSDTSGKYHAGSTVTCTVEGSGEYYYGSYTFKYYVKKATISKDNITVDDPKYELGILTSTIKSGNPILYPYLPQAIPTDGLQLRYHDDSTNLTIEDAELDYTVSVKNQSGDTIPVNDGRFAYDFSTDTTTSNAGTLVFVIKDTDDYSFGSESDTSVRTVEKEFALQKLDLGMQSWDESKLKKDGILVVESIINQYIVNIGLSEQTQEYDGEKHYIGGDSATNDPYFTTYPFTVTLNGAGGGTGNTYSFAEDGTDVKLTYTNWATEGTSRYAQDAKTYTVKAEAGTGGGTKGSKELTYEITKISGVTVTAELSGSTEFLYDAQPHYPDVVVKLEDGGTAWTGETNSDGTTATTNWTMTGTGGTYSAMLEKLGVEPTVIVSSQTSTNVASDYTLTAKLSIPNMSIDFTSSPPLTYEIKKREVTITGLTVNPTSITYTGSKRYPTTVTATLSDGTVMTATGNGSSEFGIDAKDWDITTRGTYASVLNEQGITPKLVWTSDGGKDNIVSGEYKVYVDDFNHSTSEYTNYFNLDKGTYVQTGALTYNITPVTLTTRSLTLGETKLYYTGKSNYPKSVTVRLSDGTVWEASTDNSRIRPDNQPANWVITTEGTYGSTLKSAGAYPELTWLPAAGSDEDPSKEVGSYTVYVSNYKNVDTANYTITSQAESEAETYTIGSRELGVASLKLSQSTFSYNGQSQFPNLTVVGTDGSKWTSSSVTLNNAGDAVDVDWNDPVDGDYVDTLKEYSVKPVLSWSSLTSTSTGDYTVYVTGFTGSSGASSYFGFSGQKSSEAKTYTISPVSFILRSIKLDGKTSLGFDYDGDSKYPTNIAIDAYTATTDTKNAEWVATREQSGKYTVTATNGKDDSSDPQDIYAGKSSGEAGTAGVAISKITIEVNDAGDDEFKLPGRYKVTVQMGKDFGGESISATYTIKGSIKEIRTTTANYNLYAADNTTLYQGYNSTTFKLEKPAYTSASGVASGLVEAELSDDSIISGDDILTYFDLGFQTETGARQQEFAPGDTTILAATLNSNAKKYFTLGSGVTGKFKYTIYARLNDCTVKLDKNLLEYGSSSNDNPKVSSVIWNGNNKTRGAYNSDLKVLYGFDEDRETYVSDTTQQIGTAAYKLEPLEDRYFIGYKYVTFNVGYTLDGLFVKLAGTQVINKGNTGSTVTATSLSYDQLIQRATVDQWPTEGNGVDTNANTNVYSVKGLPLENKYYTMTIADSSGTTISNYTGWKGNTEYTVTVTGKDGATGTVSGTFKITGGSLAVDTYTESFDYDGARHEAVIAMKNGTTGTALTPGTDYSISYAEGSDLVNAGTVTCIVTGLNNYSGNDPIKVQYKINAIPISDTARITVAPVPDELYDQKEKTPDVEITDSGLATATASKLTKDVDYELGYSANKSVTESARITITGKGNYTGTTSATFKIIKLKLEECTSIELVRNRAVYTGNAITANEFVACNNDYDNTIVAAYKDTDGSDKEISYTIHEGQFTANITDPAIKIQEVGSYSITLKPTADCPGFQGERDDVMVYVYPRSLSTAVQEKGDNYIKRYEFGYTFTLNNKEAEGSGSSYTVSPDGDWTPIFGIEPTVTVYDTVLKKEVASGQYSRNFAGISESGAQTGTATLAGQNASGDYSASGSNYSGSVNIRFAVGYDMSKCTVQIAEQAKQTDEALTVASGTSVSSIYDREKHDPVLAVAYNGSEITADNYDTTTVNASGGKVADYSQVATYYYSLEGKNTCYGTLQAWKNKTPAYEVKQAPLADVDATLGLSFKDSKGNEYMHAADSSHDHPYITYTGSYIKPSMTLTLNDDSSTVLVEGTDFTINSPSYANNLNVTKDVDGNLRNYGDYASMSATLIGMGNYTGWRSAAKTAFEIVPLGLQEHASFTLPYDYKSGFYYTGASIKPVPVVKITNEQGEDISATEEKDDLGYKVTYNNTTKAGCAVGGVDAKGDGSPGVVVEGKFSYSGNGNLTDSLLEQRFDVYGNLGDATVSGIKDLSYTGSTDDISAMVDCVKAAISAKIKDYDLVYDTDYQVKTVEVDDEDPAKWTVALRPASNAYVVGIKDEEITVTLVTGTGTATAVPDTVIYKADTRQRPNLAIQVDGKDYTGGYEVVSYDWSDANGNEETVTGPDERTDAYTKIGDYYLNLKLTDKPYKGLTFRSERYRIVDPADYTDLSSATVKVTPSSKYYTGEALAPDSVTVSVGNTVLAKDSAYTLVYKDASGNTIDPNNMKEVGQYTLQIDGITDNGFCGEQTATFTIKPVKTLSDDNIAVSPYKLKYTGSRRVPTVTVTYTENGNTTTLRQGSDYSLSYANAKTGAAVSSPTAVGQYYAVVTAITNSGYVGGGRRGFEIVDVAKDLVLELDSTETTYDGKAHVPTVKSVKDAAGNVVPSGTYTVAITNASGKTVTSPTNAGEYKVTASVDNLNSDYYGRSGSASYIIRKYNITDAKVSIEGISRNYDYTGSAIRPDLRLTFETTDSTASLDSSGRQSMLAAIDRLTGTMTVKAADGTTTTLVKGKDYTISAYNNNVKVGQASVIIEGKGNFTDSVEKYYKIVAPTISGLVATPVNSSKIRVSWNKTPNATKYQISYKNGDKDVSKTTKGTVINADELKSDTAVQFAVRAYVKDRYTDAKTVTAKTTKATSSGSSSGTSSSTSSNTSTSSSTTSYVYRSSSDDDDDDDKSSSSYTKAKTPKAKNVKVSSPKKGRAKIKWKDNYTYDGVEVFRSTDGVKYYKVARMVTKNSYTNKNLTSGQTYYYKVRAFSYKGSKKKNAKMSAAKAVTVQ